MALRRVPQGRDRTADRAEPPGEPEAALMTPFTAHLGALAALAFLAVLLLQ
jgi:hypothetical protein